MPTLDEARDERDDAMGIIEENTNPEWIAFMRLLLTDICQHLPFFTTNNVWDVYGSIDPAMIPYIHDKRALGPIMNNLRKEGLCEPTDEHESSTRRHATRLTVWKSFIYRSAPFATLHA